LLLTSTVDEHVSMLAAMSVAEEGIPYLPSGRLYLQGATLSYLVAPFIAFGFDTLSDLSVLRIPSVIGGTLAVLAAFFLGRTVTRSNAGGLLTAFFLAIDPISVRWSGYLRMYTLLQACCVVLACLYIQLLLRPGSNRGSLEMAIVGTFWLATFTHIAVLLVWPAMALAALLVEGRALLNRRIDLPVTLGACLLGPAALVLLNRLAGQPDRPSANSTAGSAFIGDQLLSFRQLIHPSFRALRGLFSNGSYTDVVPWLFVATSALLVILHAVRPVKDPDTRSANHCVAVMMIMFWTPVLLVAFFVEDAQGRYLIHIHPIGYAIVTMLIVELVPVLARPTHQSPALAATTWTGSAPFGHREPMTHIEHAGD
jgi:uncharacterized membrane protein